MNEYQKALYSNLINLTKQNESFYYDDFLLDESTYRIFNYRICSYSDFLLPDALQCRGVMFKVSNKTIDAIPIRLSCLTMEKFFNLNENPFTMNLDLSNVKEITEKRDGSLISTYIHNGNLRLKSKGSLRSEQAISAMQYLNDNEWLKRELTIFTSNDYTVNMEYTSPENRVVIGYQQEELTILNVRNNKTGKYCDIGLLSGAPFSIFNHEVKKIKPKNVIEFIEKVNAEEKTEGYVILLDNGQRVKIKTEWYAVRHHAKNAASSPRRLFDAVIEEATDDMRSMFFDDQWVLDKIDEMEVFVKKLLKKVITEVDSFYSAHSHFERKEYAIAAKKTVDKRVFGVAMSKYLGRPVDYKKFLRKEYKQFGISD